MAQQPVTETAEPLRLNLDTNPPPPVVATEAAVDPEIEAKATEFVDRLLEMDPADFASQQKRRDAVETAGREVQRQAAHRSRMLQEPIRTLSARGDEGGDIGSALLKLKNEVEALDPGKLDLEPGWFTRLVGQIPMVGSPLQRYFSQYETAQTVIDAIMRSLEQGRQQLHRDNITLTEDQRVMRDLSVQVDKQVQLLICMDRKLQYKLDREITPDDPRHAFVTQELMFPLRQRIQDLQQQLAVNQQAVLAIELVVRNNKELMRGVNRALEVTIGALQVAVTVALALAHQKITLDKINALNKTTSELIAKTAARLREHGTQIHQQASTAMLDFDALKHSFQDINAALSEIARFRQEALPKMSQSISELSELTARGEKAIQHLEKGRAADPGLRLELE